MSDSPELRSRLPVARAVRALFGSRRRGLATGSLAGLFAAGLLIAALGSPTTPVTPAPTAAPTLPPVAFASPTPSPVPSPTAAPLAVALDAAPGLAKKGAGTVFYTLSAASPLDPASVTAEDFAVTGGTVASVDCASATSCVIGVTPSKKGGTVSIAAASDFAVAGSGGGQTAAGGDLFTPDAKTAELVAGRYLVTFAKSATKSAQEKLLKSDGITVVDRIAPLRMATVEIAPGSGALGVLLSSKLVASAVPDRVREVTATPDDPRYADQWALERISIGAAFGVVDPAGTATVALLDTGVDATHPDLAGQLIAGKNELDGSTDTSDTNGHGTAMAGIIAARTDNATGIAGVGYAGVKVMPIVVLDESGVGRDSDVVAGVVDAVDAGARVINMSFSSRAYSAALQAAIDYAWENDVVIVAATGNEGSDAVTYPAGMAHVVGVAATDRDDALASFSNYGVDTFMAAPGVEILTTTKGGGYETVSGTSAASALVAGAAALVAATDTEASNRTIVGRLAQSGVRGDRLGNGRLNLAAALTNESSTALDPTGTSDASSTGGPYVAAANCGAQTWTGTASTSWNNVGNWVKTGNGACTVVVPNASNASITLTIPSTTNKPVLDIAGYAASVTLSASGATLDLKGFTLTISGGLTNSTGSATAISDTGVTTAGITFSGTQSITGATTFPSAVTINSGATVTLANAITVNGALSVSGTLANGGLAVSGGASSTLSVASGATLSLTGTSAFPSGFGTVTLNAASTVSYAGTTQTVSASPTYGNLTIAGSGTKTLGGAISPAGTLTVSAGTLDNGGYAISGTGALTVAAGTTLSLSGSSAFPSVSGTVTLNATSTVAYTGSTAQTIAAKSYGHLTLNNASGAGLAAATSVAGNLTLTSGVLAAGSYTLTVTGTASGSSSSYVTGTLAHPISAAGTFDFPVGSGTTYAPVSISVTTKTANGTLAISTTGSAHPSLSGSDFDTTNKVNRYWTLAGTGGLAITYSPTFSYVAADLGGSFNTTAAVVRSYASGWSSSYTTGTRTSTSAQATGVTTVSGDFVVGTTVATRLALSSSASSEPSQVTSTFQVGSSPISVAVTSDGAKLYVLDNGGDRVSVLNAATGSTTSTITPPFLDWWLHAKSVAVYGSRLYLADYTSAYLYDTATNAYIKDVTPPALSPPYPSAVAFNGTHYYLLNDNSGAGTVSQVDFLYDSTTWTLGTVDAPAISNPSGIAAHPNDSKVYVTSSTGNGVVVLTNDPGPNTTSITNTIPVGSTPHGIAILPSGTKLYVANSGADTVSVINVSSETVSSTITVGTNPEAIAISPDGTRAYVTNSGSNTVSVINTSTDAVIKTVAVGLAPKAITVSPDGKKVYAVNSGSSSVSVLAAAEAAGASFNLTITAYDGTGGVAGGYNGSKSLTFSGANTSAGPTATAPTVTNSSGTATAFGSATSITFTNGVATVSGSNNGVITLYKVETASIVASDGTINSSANPLSVSVAQGALNALSFGTQPSNAALYAPINPAVTVSAIDAYGNAYSGASVTMTTATGTPAVVAVTGTTTANTSTSGVATFDNLYFSDYGTYTIKATSGAKTATSSSFSVVPPCTNNVWTGAVSTDWYDTGNWGAPDGTCVGKTPSNTTDATLPASVASGRWPSVTTGNPSVRNITINGGAITIAGYTINLYGSSLTNNSASADVILGSTGGITLNAANTTVSGPFNFGGALRASGGSTTFTSNITVAGGFYTAPSSASTYNFGSNTVSLKGLYWGSTNAIMVGANSTFQFVGTSAQTIYNVSTFPGSVIINNSAGVSLYSSASGSTVTGPLTVTAGTLALDSYTLNVKGNITNSAAATSITGATSTLNLNGTSAQTITGATTIPGNLTVANSAGVTLASNVTVTGTLNLGSNIITTGANTLTASGTVSRTSGFVSGNLKKPLTTGQTNATFEVGTGTAYAPVTLSAMNVSTGGTLTATTAAGTATDFANSGLSQSQYVNRYWSLTSGGSLAVTDYTASFAFVSNDLVGSPNTSALVVKKNASGWSSPTSSSSTATSATATGLGTTFGTYAVAESGLLSQSAFSIDAGQSFGYSPSGTFTPATTGGSGSGTVTFTSSTTGVCTASGSATVTIVTVGTCSLTATRAGDASYSSITSASQNVTIAKANQATLTLTGTTSPVTYGAATQTMSYSGGSGTGAVSYTSSTTGVCTVSGSTLTFIAAGTCSVYATKAADTNYNSATSATVNITVNAKALSITATDRSKTYGNDVTSLYFGSGQTAFTSSGLVGSDSITSVTLADPSICGQAYATAGALCLITPSAAVFGTGNAANYSITYNYGFLTVNKAVLNVNAVAKSKDYGAADPSLTWTYSGYVNNQSGDPAGRTGSASCSRTAGETVGVYTITCVPDSLASTNYTFTTGTTAAFTIGAKALSITATDQNKTYGVALTSPATGQSAFTSAGLVGSETIGSLTLAYGTCGTSATAAAGTTCSITPSAATGGTFTASNYTITYNTGTLTVAKADQVTLTIDASQSFPYASGGTFTPTVTGGSGAGTVTFTSSTTGVCTASGSPVVTIVTTGTCSLTAVKSADTNYNASATSASQNVTIAPLCTAQTWNGSAGTSWATGANWTGTAPSGCSTIEPNATVDVTIPSSATNLPVLGANAAARSLTFTGSASKTLLALGSSTLTLSGNLTNQNTATNTPMSGSTSTIVFAASAAISNISTTTLTIPGGITANDGVAVTFASSPANTSVTVTGTLTTLGTGSITPGSGQTLTLKGNVALDLNGGLADGVGSNNGSTITFAGPGAQVLNCSPQPVLIPGNLIIASGGAVSSQRVAIYGTTTLTSGTFSGAGVNDLYGNLTNNAAATALAGGDYTFRASATIAGATSFPGALSATSANNLTLSSAVTVAGDFSMGTGTLALGANNLTLKGAVTFGKAAPTTGTGSLIFAGSSMQSPSFVANTAHTGGLRVSNAAGVTFGQSLSFDGAVTLDSGTSLALGATTLTVKGGWTNSGATLTGATSTVTFGGSAAQTISGATTFPGSLTIDDAGGVALGANVVVTGNLTVNAGTLTLGDYTAARASSGGTLSVANGAALSIGSSGTGGLPANYATTSFGASSTVTYASTNDVTGQTVTGADYGNLTLSDYRKVLTNATIRIAGTFTPGAGVLTITGSTIDFSGTGTQVVPAISYHNLTWSGTGSRTISSGTTRIAGTFTRGSNAYTVTAGSTVNFNGSVAQPIPAINYENLTVSGSNRSGSVTLANSGTIGVSGTFSYTATYVSGGLVTDKSTISFNGAAQTVPAFAFHHLTLAGSGAKTLGGNISVAGDLASGGSASLTANAKTISFNGSGTSSLSLPGGTSLYGLTVAGPTVNTTGYGYITGPLTLTSGSLNTGGNLTIISGTISQPVGGAALTGNNVQISGDGNLVPFGAYYGLTLTGAKAFAPSGTIAISGYLSTDTSSNTVTGSTVEFSGTDQTIPALNYNNLTLSGSGTVTLAAGTTSVAGTFTPGTASYVATGNTMSFTGSAQTIPAFAYGGLSVASATSPALGGSATVADTLALGATTLSTGAYAIRANGSITRSSGFVAGSLTLPVTSSGQRDFPIGSGTTYAPVSLVVSGVGTAGALTAKTTGSAHPQVSSSGFSSAKRLNRYWTLTALDGLSSNFAPTFTFVSGDLAAGTDASLLYAKRYTADTDWSIYLPVTSRTASSTTLGPISNIYGDFSLGERTASATTLATSAASVTYGTPITLTATVTPSDATGLVTFYDGATSLGSCSLTSGSCQTTTGARTLGAGAHSLTASYAGDTNYPASSSTALSQTVTPRTLTVTATAQDKTYDGTATASVTLSNDRLAGDTLTVSYASATFASAAVGTGKTVTIAGLSIAGAASSNYSLAASSITTTASITQATSTTSVTSSANPGFLNEPVTFTASVSPATATGTVTFTENGTTIGSCTLVAAPSCGIDHTFTSLGSHTVRATYAGDTNHTGSYGTVTISVQVGAPTIASFTPSSGYAGDTVTISGTNLAGTTGVTFGGVAASFIADSDTSLRAYVPGGADDGPIAVTTPSGTATGTTDFIILVAAPGTPDLLTADDHGSSSLDDLTNATSLRFTVSAASGLLVTVTASSLGGGPDIVASATAANGSATVTLGAFAEGAYDVRAVAASGTKSGQASSALRITVDLTAPAAPATPTLATASDTGTSSTDAITKTTAPTLLCSADAVRAVRRTTTRTGVCGGSLSLGEGIWYASAVARDAAGNETLSDGLRVVVDTTAPLATFTSPAADTVLDWNTISVGWTETETLAGLATRSIAREKGVATSGVCGSFADDNATTSALSPRTDENLSYDVCYRYVATLTDIAGNSGTTTSASVRTVTSISTSSIHVVATLRGTDTTVTSDSTVIVLNAATGGGGAGIMSEILGADVDLDLTDGTWDVAATVAGASGAESGASSTTVIVDTVGPTTPTLAGFEGAACSGTTYPPAGEMTWTKSSVAVCASGSTDEGGSGVYEYRYTTNGVAPTADSGTAIAANTAIPVSANGLTTVKVIAVDVAGNESAVATFEVRIDKTNPTQPTATGHLGAGCAGDVVATDTWAQAESVTVCFSGSTDVGGSGVKEYRYTTNGVDPLANTGTAGSSVNVAARGATTVKVIAVDNVGNKSAVRSFIVKIDTTAPVITWSSPSAATFLNASAFTPFWSIADDESGMASNGTVVMEHTDLVANECGASWTSDGEVTKNVEVTNLAADSCYRFRFSSAPRNNANLTTTDDLTSPLLKVDTAGPAIKWTTPAATTYRTTTDTYAPAWTVTDTATDVLTAGVVARYIADLTAGTCGDFALDATPISSGGAGAALLDDRCYEWVFTEAPVDLAGVASNANLTSPIVKVDTTAPVITWNAPSEATYRTTTPYTPSWSVTDAESGVASYGTVKRQQTGLLSDTCTGADWGSSVTATSDQQVTLSAASCFRWTFAASAGGVAPSNNAGLAATGNFTSAEIKVDTSPPAQPTLTLTTVAGAPYTPGTATESAYQASANSAVFFRPAAAAASPSPFPITIEASSSDAETLVASSTFGSMTSPTGWTANPSLVLSSPTPVSGNPASVTISFASNAVTASLPVISTNRAGKNSAMRTLALTADAAAPSLTFSAPGAAAYRTSTTYTPAWSVADVGGGAGLVDGSAVVYRQKASLSAGSCGAWSPDGLATSGEQVTLDDGYCFRWTADSSLVASAVKPVDRVGNRLADGAAGLTSAIVKVDTTLPTLTWEKPATPAYYTSAAAYQPTWTSADAQSGIASEGTAKRQWTTLAANACGSDWTTDLGAQGNGADTALSGARCYRFTFDALLATGAVAPTNGAGIAVDANLTSPTLKVDPTAPSQPAATVVTVAGSPYVLATATDSVYQAGANATVFFRPAAAGSLTLRAASSDDETGIERISFAASGAAGALPVGFSSSSSVPGADTSAPYDLPLSFTGAAADATVSATARNGAGTDSAVRVSSLVADTAGPTITFSVLMTALNTTGSITPDYTSADPRSVGVPNGAGVSTVAFTRTDAPYSNGSCGSYDAATQVSVAKGEGQTLESGRCYRYVAVATDNVGNETTSERVVKVDTSKPTAIVVTTNVGEAGGPANAYVSGSTVFFRPDRETLAATSFSLRAQSTDPQSGVVLDFGALAPNATGWSSSQALPYHVDGGDGTIGLTASASVTGTRTMTITATNGVALTETRTMTFAADDTPPSGAVIGCARTPQGAFDPCNGGWSNATSVTVSVSGATDSGSGLRSANPYEYRLTREGGTPGAWKSGGSVEVSDEGITTVSFRVFDNVNNESETVSKDVRLDRKSPSLAIAPAATVTNTVPVTVSATSATDTPGVAADGASVTASGVKSDGYQHTTRSGTALNGACSAWSGSYGPVATANPTWNLGSDTAAACFELAARVMDNAGNWSSTAADPSSSSSAPAAPGSGADAAGWAYAAVIFEPTGSNNAITASLACGGSEGSTSGSGDECWYRPGAGAFSPTLTASAQSASGLASASFGALDPATNWTTNPSLPATVSASGLAFGGPRLTAGGEAKQTTTQSAGPIKTVAENSVAGTTLTLTMKPDYTAPEFTGTGWTAPAPGPAPEPAPGSSSGTPVTVTLSWGALSDTADNSAPGSGIGAARIDRYTRAQNADGSCPALLDAGAITYEFEKTVTSIGVGNGGSTSDTLAPSRACFAYRLVAADAVGNSWRYDSSVVSYPDWTPPTITAISPDPAGGDIVYTNQAARVITWTAEDQALALPGGGELAGVGVNPAATTVTRMKASAIQSRVDNNGTPTGAYDTCPAKNAPGAWESDESLSGAQSGLLQIGLLDAHCYYWQISVRDYAWTQARSANHSAVATSGRIFIDTTAPALTDFYVSASRDAQSKQTTVLSGDIYAFFKDASDGGSGLDGTPYYVRLVSDTYAIGRSSPINILVRLGPSAGEYLVAGLVRDRAGNTTERIVSVTRTSGGVAPSVIGTAAILDSCTASTTNITNEIGTIFWPVGKELCFAPNVKIAANGGGRLPTAEFGDLTASLDPDPDNDSAVEQWFLLTCAATEGNRESQWADGMCGARMPGKINGKLADFDGSSTILVLPEDTKARRLWTVGKSWSVSALVNPATPAPNQGGVFYTILGSTMTSPNNYVNAPQIGLVWDADPNDDGQFGDGVFRLDFRLADGSKLNGVTKSGSFFTSRNLNNVIQPGEISTVAVTASAPVGGFSTITLWVNGKLAGSASNVPYPDSTAQFNSIGASRLVDPRVGTTDNPTYVPQNFFKGGLGSIAAYQRVVGKSEACRLDSTKLNRSAYEIALRDARTEVAGCDKFGSGTNTDSYAPVAVWTLDASGSTVSEPEDKNTATSTSSISGESTAPASSDTATVGKGIPLRFKLNNETVGGQLIEVKMRVRLKWQNAAKTHTEYESRWFTVSYLIRPLNAGLAGK